MVFYMSITANAQNQSVPIMDKEVHGNKQQAQFTGIFQNIQFIHNNRRIKTTQERKRSWKFFAIHS